MVIKAKQNSSSSPSQCAAPDTSATDKQTINNNISAILSNGIHSTYLLNTMTNPSSLPYSNYMMTGNESGALNCSSTSFQNQAQNQFSSNTVNIQPMKSKSSQIQSIATTEMPSITSVSSVHSRPPSTDKSNAYSSYANLGLIRGWQNQLNQVSQHQSQLTQQQQQQQHRHFQSQQSQHFPQVQLGQYSMNPYSNGNGNGGNTVNMVNANSMMNNQNTATQQLHQYQLALHHQVRAHQQAQAQQAQQISQQQFKSQPQTSLNAMAAPFLHQNTNVNVSNTNMPNHVSHVMNPYSAQNATVHANALRRQQAMQMQQSLLAQQQKQAMQRHLSRHTKSQHHHQHVPPVHSVQSHTVQQPHSQQPVQPDLITVPAPSIAIASLAPNSPVSPHPPSPPIPYVTSMAHHVPVSGPSNIAMTAGSRSGSGSGSGSGSEEKSQSQMSALDLIAMSEGKDNETDESQDIEIQSVSAVPVPGKPIVIIPNEFTSSIHADYSKIIGVQEARSLRDLDDSSTESKSADILDDKDRDIVPAPLIPKNREESSIIPEAATMDEILGMTASLQEDLLAQELEKKGERVPVLHVTNTIGLDIDENAKATRTTVASPIQRQSTIQSPIKVQRELPKELGKESDESQVDPLHEIEIEEIASAAVQEVTQQLVPLEPPEPEPEAIPPAPAQVTLPVSPAVKSKRVRRRPKVVMPMDIIQGDRWRDPDFIAKRKRAMFSFLDRWDQYPTTSEVGEREQRSRISSLERSAQSKPSHSPQAPPGLQKLRNGKPIQSRASPPTQQKQSQKSHPSRRRVTMPQSEGARSHSLHEQSSENKSKYFLQSPNFAFQGTFEEAKSAAIHMNRWIMLNIQDNDLFTAQWSTPLLWKHKKYQVIIQQNFVFYNCIKFADSAMGLVNVYNIHQIPSVCIIDPYSNQKRFEFVAPSTSSNIIKLREQIMNLLQSFPTPMECADDSFPAVKPRKPPILNRNRSTPAIGAHDHCENREHRQHPRNRSSSSRFARSRSFVESATTSKYESDSRSPPHRPSSSQSSGSSSATSPIIPCASTTASRTRCPPRKTTKKGLRGYRFSSALEISALSHIYCNPEPAPSNIWDVHYPYHNLKNTAYVLTTRQTMDWNDWMLIIMKCTKIVGAIPSEQQIEFVRNRNGEMALESSGTFIGWWSEQRVAEYVVNEKFGLCFEGGFASESGRDRKKFLKSLELARRPTFKKMLVLLPNLSHHDRMLLHEHSLSITPYADYDKMDNITSFQLWLSLITFLSVNMYETSAMYRHHQFKQDQCTNFCFKLGNKWKLPLSTLYNDIEPLLTHSECKSLLFSFPKIATDAAAHCTAAYSAHYHHGKSSSSNGSNKYHAASSLADPPHERCHEKSKSAGLAVNFLSKSGKLSGRGFKYDTKRTKLVQSYEELESVLTESEPHEVIDFPYPLFSSGWFSFNTLSLFATILEQHLDGTWVNMFSASNGKQFKQIFETNKNTRRRSVVYEKLLHQQAVERSNQHCYMQVADHLSLKNKRRFVHFWTENRLHWTDLVIDPVAKTNQSGSGLNSNNYQYRNSNGNGNRQSSRNRNSIQNGSGSRSESRSASSSHHHHHHHHHHHQQAPLQQNQQLRNTTNAMRGHPDRHQIRRDRERSEPVPRRRRGSGPGSGEVEVEVDNESIISMHKNHNNLTYRKKKRSRDRLKRSCSSSGSMRSGRKDRRTASKENHV